MATFPIALLMAPTKNSAPSRNKPMGEAWIGIPALLSGLHRMSFSLVPRLANFSWPCHRSPVRCLKAFTRPAFPTREAGDGGAF